MFKSYCHTHFSTVGRSRFPPQYSGGTPLGALCGRGDLDPVHPRLSGCYDSKATTWRLALALESDAGGPR